MRPAEIDQALAIASDRGDPSGLLALGESQWFDRKSGRVAPKDLAASLVAFANAEGGVLVVGLHDGAVDGVPEEKMNALRQAAQDFTQPAVRAVVRELRLTDGKLLAVLQASPGERVHETMRGECYLRVGDESRRLGFAQRQELEFDRGAAPYEGASAGIGLDELDEHQLERFSSRIGSTSVDLMLRARSLLTRDGELTVAAQLLFAEHPQRYLPHAHVRVLRYLADERGAGSEQTLAEGGDIRCEGSLPEQVDEAAAMIERFMPARRALGASGRFEATGIVPRDAWLEGLVNAVVHRSYSASGDHIRVEVFPSRIEITSPGRFPGLADPTDPLSVGRHARNPRIARVFADLGVTQELGEGIRRIFAEMRRVGLVDPVYLQSSSAVRLTLAAANAIPAEVRAVVGPKAIAVLDVMRRAGRPLGTGQVGELAGLTRPTVLRHLRLLLEHDLIQWTGESPKDPRATWQLR